MKLESKINKYYKKINDIGVSLNEKYEKTSMTKDLSNRTITIETTKEKIYLNLVTFMLGRMMLIKNYGCGVTIIFLWMINRQILNTP